MENEIKYDRPNTVSGLLAKRKELQLLCTRYRDEIRKLTSDIGHLDAAIKVFDPHGETYAMKDAVTRPRAKRGEVKAFLLNTLRESEVPLTSRQMADKWALEKSMPTDEHTITEVRKKLSASIKDCVKQGLVEPCGQTTDHDRWGPYKLWRIAQNNQM